MKNMETKHTPTPWKVKGSNLAFPHGHSFRAEWIEPNICEMVSSRPPDEVAHNAALIVKAVNQHAALTVALDQAVEALEAASEVGEIKFGTCVLSRQVANQITAALDAAKKARG